MESESKSRSGGGLLHEGERPSRRGFLLSSTATAAIASGMAFGSATWSQAAGELNARIHHKAKKGAKSKHTGGTGSGMPGGGQGAGVSQSAAGQAEANASKKNGPTPGSKNKLPDLFRGQNATYFQSIQAHENAHVALLFQALSDPGINKAFTPPANFFQGLEQSSVHAFAMTAQTFENVGVGAYLGALPLIANSPYLSTAGSIALIEARHAGYLNTLMGTTLTMSPGIPGEGDTNLEEPLTPDQVFTLITPFLTDPAATHSLLFPVHDAVSVLRFALALEYLEATFYNLNVPKFTRNF